MHSGTVIASLFVFATTIGSARAEPSGTLTTTADVSGVEADAHSGTAVLSPTAFTAPAGSTSVRLRELSIGMTQNVGGVVDLSVDVLSLGMVGAALGVKVQAYRSQRVGLALVLDVGAVHWMDATNGAALAGGVATFCTSQECDSTVSASVGAGVSMGWWKSYGGGSHRTSVIGAISLVQRLGGRVKLVGELLGVVGDVDDARDKFVTVSGATRLFWREFAFDIGVIQMLGKNDGWGLPWFAMSGRWQ